MTARWNQPIKESVRWLQARFGMSPFIVIIIIIIIITTTITIIAIIIVINMLLLLILLVYITRSSGRA